MSGDVLRNIIVPRMPGREITPRFWTWLQEQFEKIAVALSGRSQLVSSNFASIGNPAAAGSNQIATHVIDKAILDGLYVDVLIVNAFGTTAANNNNKTITLKLNGIVIAEAVLAGAAANAKTFWAQARCYITSPSTQKVIAIMAVDGVAVKNEYNTLAIDVLTTDLTFAMFATSAASAANDVMLQGFTLEAARTQRT